MNEGNPIELTRAEITAEREYFEGFMEEAFGVVLMKKALDENYRDPWHQHLWTGWLGRAVLALRITQPPLEIATRIKDGKTINITLP